MLLALSLKIKYKSIICRNKYAVITVAWGDEDECVGTYFTYVPDQSYRPYENTTNNYEGQDVEHWDNIYKDLTLIFVSNTNLQSTL